MKPPKQIDLYEDSGARALVLLDALGDETPGNETQARFKRLLRDLEQHRALLERWVICKDRCHRRVSEELAPREDELWKVKRELVLMFDATLDRPGGPRGKRQRHTLKKLVVQLSRELLGDQPDPTLEAIHDKYSEATYAEDQELDLALSQSMIERITGVEMGKDHGARTLEELLHAAHVAMASRQREEEDATVDSRREKAKSRKASQAQVRREAAIREASISVREVFRKLASALHPDRAGDPEDRQRRTEQMARVNQAYENGDLLALLNIQLEIEQIDTAHLASLSEARLNSYIAAFREQLSQVKREVRDIAGHFKRLLPHVRQITPERVDRELSDDIRRLEENIQATRADIEALRDPKKLSALLNRLKKDLQRENTFVDDMPLDFF